MMRNIAPLFAEVARRLESERPVLNQADSYNANHGDHMVEIFQTASQAVDMLAADSQAGGLPQALDSAARCLAGLPANGTAQVYAQGLAQFAEAFRRSDLELDDLVYYVQGLLNDDVELPSTPRPAGDNPKATEVLKALTQAMAGWEKAASGGNPADNRMNMNFLFDLGIAYMQARQRNESKIGTIADAAASASPLRQVPHRYTSGKLALQTLLEALATSA